MLLCYLLGTMDVISGIISLLVSVFAYRSYRTIKEKPLLFLGLSFSLIGLGILMKGVSLFFLHRRTVQLVVVCVLISRFAKILSYLILALTYTIQLRTTFLKVVLALPLLKYLLVNPIADAIAIFLLCYIIFHLSLTFINEKNILTLFVTLAFSCLLLSHLLSIISYYSLSLLVLFISSIMQVLGFSLMLIILIEIGRKK